MPQIPQVNNAYTNFAANRGVSESKWVVSGWERCFWTGSGRFKTGHDFDRSDRNDARKIAAPTILRSSSAIPPLRCFFRSLDRSGTVDCVCRVRSYDLTIYSAILTTLAHAPTVSLKPINLYTFLTRCTSTINSFLMQVNQS
jgi:hypothetical protein